MRGRALVLAWMGCLALMPGCAPLVVTGVGTSALMAEDRRTAGTVVDDDSIEAKVSFKVSEHYGRDTHVDVTSFNRVVLLAGAVTSEAAKQDIERIARTTENVRAVQNELTVGPVPSVAAQAHDAYITSKIKAHFLDAGRFYPNHVKVDTEAGTVYLMGLVKHQEADAATDIARSVDGVVKVVRIFEYID